MNRLCIRRYVVKLGGLTIVIQIRKNLTRKVTWWWPLQVRSSSHRRDLFTFHVLMNCHVHKPVEIKFLCFLGYQKKQDFLFSCAQLKNYGTLWHQIWGDSRIGCRSFAVLLACYRQPISLADLPHVFQGYEGWRIQSWHASDFQGEAPTTLLQSGGMILQFAEFISTMCW